MPYVSRCGLALWVLCGLVAPGIAASLHDFNIPAQSLDAALRRYGDITDQPAVFVSDLVRGRTSSPVFGRYESEAALKRLLEGTGLDVQKITSGVGTTFLLKATSPAAPRSDPSQLARFFSLGGYPALLQRRVWDALCADDRTVPGRYESVFQFQIDASGHLQDARLLDSTGDAGRDAALLRALDTVHLDAPPPAAVLHQPLTLRLATGRAAGMSCRPAQAHR